MGRYTQRRRAQSGPAASGVAPPTGASITDVHATGSPGVVQITFDAVVTFFPGGYFDSNFSIAGNPVMTVNTIPSSPGTIVEVTVSGSWSSGSPWSVSGQPSWVTTAIANPQSGTVS